MAVRYNNSILKSYNYDMEKNSLQCFYLKILPDIRVTAGGRHGIQYNIVDFH